MNKESFVFYKSWLESIEEIENEATKSKAYKTIALYALFGEEPTKETEEIIRVIFKQAKPLLDKSKARYDNCIENGKKGGAPKGNKNAKKQPKNNPELTKKQPTNNQKTTKEQPKNNQETRQNNLNDNDNDNDNDNVNENDNYNDNEERNNQREKQIESFLNSLSQNFSKIEINTKSINSDYDLDKIINAIKQSEYLQNTSLSFILNNYEKVITNYYKTFKQEGKQAFQSRDYSNEIDYFENLYDNLDDLNL